MHSIHLTDELYREAQRRASEAGFDSVDAYVANIVQLALEDTDAVERLFTPERLALIDRAAADIEAGLGLNRGQVENELVRRKHQWLRQQK